MGRGAALRGIVTTWRATVEIVLAGLARRRVLTRHAWIGLFGLFIAAQPLAAQTYQVGQSGWRLERLSNDFVVLRTSVERSISPDQPPRRGLLVLTCERQARRIRFQLGDTPNQPSTQFSELGRATVRGERDGKSTVLAAVNPRVRFFPDGSFELFEAIGFGDPAMREFLHLLQRLPNRLEILLFKGPETVTSSREAPRRFEFVRLEESLSDLYGFEGLCFRQPD